MLTAWASRANQVLGATSAARIEPPDGSRVLHVVPYQVQRCRCTTHPKEATWLSELTVSYHPVVLEIKSMNTCEIEKIYHPRTDQTDHEISMSGRISSSSPADVRRGAWRTYIIPSWNTCSARSCGLYTGSTGQHIYELQFVVDRTRRAGGADLSLMI